LRSVRVGARDRTVFRIGRLRAAVGARTWIEVAVVTKEVLVPLGGSLLAFLFDVRWRPHAPATEVVALQA
jgi:hypothetical protein